MAIAKQEFYEGAAIHALVCSGGVRRIVYDHPFFVVNESVRCYVKYSTRVRSPWSFTFAPQEQKRLHLSPNVMIAMVCGSDGVVAITSEEYSPIAAVRPVSIHLGCHREHRSYYEVVGPDGDLGRRISPSRWKRLLID